jgi:hypothetical protein
VAKVPLKSAAFSLLGFSFAAGWEVNEDEEKAVKALVAFLVDRRVLRSPYVLKNHREAEISVEKIRHHCNALMSKFELKCPAALAAWGIERTCRAFLKREPGSLYGPNAQRQANEFAFLKHDLGFFVAIGELRARVGDHLAALAQFYDVEVGDELSAILPKGRAREVVSEQR